MKAINHYTTPAASTAASHAVPGWLEGLSPEVRSRLVSQSRQVEVRAGQVVASMGEPMVAFVQRGWFKLSRFTELGDEQLLGLRGKGSCVGLEALASVDATAPEITALSAGTLLVWPLELMRSLAAREISLTRALLDCLAAQIEEATNRRLREASSRVNYRLARLLCDFAVEEGRPSADGLFVCMPFTQTDLALMLGVRRETVNVGLGELEAQGVLHRCGRELFIRPQRVAEYLESENAFQSYSVGRHGGEAMPRAIAD